MKGDPECEQHLCEGLPYCQWHPNDCNGKPWGSYDGRPVGICVWLEFLRRNMQSFEWLYFHLSDPKRNHWFGIHPGETNKRNPYLVYWGREKHTVLDKPKP